MARNKKKDAPRSHVSIDIEGVSLSSRIGELTVTQFIELILQIAPHVQKLRSNPDRAALLERVLGEMRKQISLRGKARKDGISGAVQDAQLAILNRMPEMMKFASGFESSSGPQVKK